MSDHGPSPDSRKASLDSASSVPGSERSSVAPEVADFSLMLGGPLFQFLMRARLLRSPLDLVHRRVFASIIITWLPLAAMTALAGDCLSGDGVPFLRDLDVHVRLLVALPMLILAELFVHRHIRPAIEQFPARGLIAPEDMARFDSIIGRALRLRNSVTVEVLLLALAFGWHWLWRSQAALHVVTWYAVPAEGSMHYTAAGYWYVLVSLPIVRFILLRWYFRILVWYLLMWRISGLGLKLNPLHPDRAGGLGFLGSTVLAFTPLLVAQSTSLAGVIGTQIWHAGAKLPEFRYEIAGCIVFLVLLALVPLMFFSLQLAETKRRGCRLYGAFASRYVDEFRRKWLLDRAAPGDELLGTGDIQSLADLGNSYQVVNEMQSLPFGKGMVISLAIVIALPLLPLALTMVPFEEILRRLVSMVL